MSEPIKATDIHWHDGAVTPAERAKLLKQRGATIWLTGFSGSGKSTLAVALEQVLVARGHAAYVLDGDNVRFGLNAGPKILLEQRGYSEDAARRFGLAFSAEDREENIRRVGEVASLFADAGVVCITSFISPYRADRARARQAVKNGAGFHEIYVAADLATCEARDPKGLYQKARAGQIKEFTGIDSPYEAPETPDLVVDTRTHDVETCVAQLLDYIEMNFRATVARA